MQAFHECGTQRIKFAPNNLGSILLLVKTVLKGGMTISIKQVRFNHVKNEKLV